MRRCRIASSSASACEERRSASVRDQRGAREATALDRALLALCWRPRGTTHHRLCAAPVSLLAGQSVHGTSMRLHCGDCGVSKREAMVCDVRANVAPAASHCCRRCTPNRPAVSPPHPYAANALLLATAAPSYAYAYACVLLLAVGGARVNLLCCNSNTLRLVLLHAVCCALVPPLLGEDDARHGAAASRCVGVVIAVRDELQQVAKHQLRVWGGEGDANGR